MASLQSASSRPSVYGSRQSVIVTPQPAVPQAPTYYEQQYGAATAPETIDIDDLMSSLNETASVRSSVQPQQAYSSNQNHRQSNSLAAANSKPTISQSMEDILSGLEGPTSALAPTTPAPQNQYSAAAQTQYVSPAKPVARPAPTQPGYRGTMGQLDDILGLLPSESQNDTSPITAKRPAASNSSSIDSMVADLTSKLGAPTTRGTCGACRKEIVGDCVQAMGKKFHVDHWVCVSCQTPLMTTEWFDMQGKPTCKKCMASLHSAR